jgi:hypothetical protein
MAEQPKLGGRVIAPAEFDPMSEEPELEFEEPDFLEDEDDGLDDKGQPRPIEPHEAQSALDAMLTSEPQQAPSERYILKRLGFTVTLTGISEREIDQIGRRSERQPSRSEKARGLVTAQRDIAKFNLLLVASGMTDPDLSHAELRAKYGQRPEDIVQAWFLPGEIVQMADMVMDLSGYSDEAVVRAKK